MYASMSFGIDQFGNVVSPRLMGLPDQCLALRTTDASAPEGVPRSVVLPEEWCLLAYPHDGDHDFSGGDANG